MHEMEVFRVHDRVGEPATCTVAIIETVDRAANAVSADDIVVVSIVLKLFKWLVNCGELANVLVVISK